MGINFIIIRNKWVIPVTSAFLLSNNRSREKQAYWLLTCFALWRQWDKSQFYSTTLMESRTSYPQHIKKNDHNLTTVKQTTHLKKWITNKHVKLCSAIVHGLYGNTILKLHWDNPENYREDEQSLKLKPCNSKHSKEAEWLQPSCARGGNAKWPNCSEEQTSKFYKHIC